MKSKKTTRNALFTSLMSLLLCASMLLGTTFAWFTDSVTSTGNIIKSGTLDVEMSWSDTNSANEADWKDASAGAIFDYKFWEPGFTQIKYVKIANVGDLAFQYQLNILPDAAVTGPFNLADVIEAYLMPMNAGQTVDRDDVDAFMTANTGATLAQLMADPDGAAYGTMYPVHGKGAQNMTIPTGAVEGEVTYCVVLHMQEEAGNEYQNLSVGDGFSVQLLATQLTAEIDSFGPDYDVDSEYDEVYVPTTASGSASALDADSNGLLDEAVTIPDGVNSITFPKNTKLADNATELTFKVSGAAAPAAGTAINADDAYIALNIDVEGVDFGNEGNDQPITVTYQTLKGMKDVVVYHKGVAMDASAVSYNEATGIITITSTSFSPFDIVFDAYTVLANDQAVGNSIDEVKDLVTPINGVVTYDISGDVVFAGGWGEPVAPEGTTKVVFDGIGAEKCSLNLSHSYRNQLYAPGAVVEMSDITVDCDPCGTHQDERNIWVTAEAFYATDVTFCDPGDASNVKTAVFDSCVFDCAEENDNNYQLWIGNHDAGYDAVTKNVTVKNCTFKASGRAIKMAAAADTYTALIDGNTFEALSKKPAICLNYGDQANKVTITNNTVYSTTGLVEDELGDAAKALLTMANNSVEIAVSEGEDMSAALVNNATVQLDKGEYDLPSLSGKEGITIIGTEGTVIGGEDASNAFYYSNFGKDTTIKNVTFSGTTNGVRYSYANGGSSTFENCTFAGDSTYGFHIDQSNGATFTFNNCTFSGFNAFAGDLEKVIFNNCTFLNNGNYGHTNIWSVAEFNNCTWGDKTSVSQGKNSGAKLYFNGVEESYHHEFIGSAESLFAFAESVNVGGDKWTNQKVLLVKDIDLANAEWTPIGQTGATEFKGIFDGQNHTISNLKIDSSAQTGEHYSSGLFGWAESAVTIQNVKVDGATVIGDHNVAVIVGYTYSGKVSNCHVSNAAITCNHANADACGDKCGLIAGYSADEAKISNCSGSDSTVTAGRDAGQLIGSGIGLTLSGCSATNVTVSATGDCNREGNINQTLIGRTA